MDQDTAASIESILYEFVAGFKVFEQVFIVNIVHLHDLVGKILKELLVEWQL